MYDYDAQCNNRSETGGIFANGAYTTAFQYLFNEATSTSEDSEIDNDRDLYRDLQNKATLLRDEILGKDVLSNTDRLSGYRLVIMIDTFKIGRYFSVGRSLLVELTSPRSKITFIQRLLDTVGLIDIDIPVAMSSDFKVMCPNGNCGVLVQNKHFVACHKLAARCK